MRLKLTLRYPKGKPIPVNYNYLLSSWIYKQLSKANPGFATWLHEQGYSGEAHRKFKLFTFGQLRGAPFRIDRDTITYNTDKLEWELSFAVPDALQNFVAGTFQNLHLGIGDGSLAPVDMYIEYVEIINKPVFQPIMRYRTETPICISRHVTGEKNAYYVFPNEADFGSLFLQNLYQKGLSTGMESTMPLETSFQLLDNPFRSKLIQIKDTKIRCFLFDFELKAPRQLQELGYFAGFGLENAQGLGMVQELR